MTQDKDPLSLSEMLMKLAVARKTIDFHAGGAMKVALLDLLDIVEALVERMRVRG